MCVAGKGRPRRGGTDPDRWTACCLGLSAAGLSCTWSIYPIHPTVKSSQGEGECDIWWRASPHVLVSCSRVGQDTGDPLFSYDAGVNGDAVAFAVMASSRLTGSRLEIGILGRGRVSTVELVWFGWSLNECARPAVSHQLQCNSWGRAHDIGEGLSVACCR